MGLITFLPRVGPPSQPPCVSTPLSRPTSLQFGATRAAADDNGVSEYAAGTHFKVRGFDWRWSLALISLFPLGADMGI